MPTGLEDRFREILAAHLRVFKHTFSYASNKIFFIRSIRNAYIDSAHQSAHLAISIAYSLITRRPAARGNFSCIKELFTPSLHSLRTLLFRSGEFQCNTPRDRRGASLSQMADPASGCSCF